jgi:hypothetical protein
MSTVWSPARPKTALATESAAEASAIPASMAQASVIAQANLIAQESARFVIRPRSRFFCASEFLHY